MQILLLIVLVLALDFYAFQAVRVIVENLSPGIVSGITFGYWAFTVFSIIVLVAAFLTNTNEWNKSLFTVIRAVIFIVYFAKVIIAVFLLIDDARRLIMYGVEQFSGSTGFDGSRSRFLSNLAIILGGIPIVTLVYGIFRNAYRYKVYRESIPIPGLPDGLKGLKIIQISDIHSGSFFLKEPIQNAIDLINSENPDVVLFTGDMVNTIADEMEPYTDLFGQIKAKYGVYSVRGNHDYGDYTRWPSAEAKAANHKKFETIQASMGWDLLKNENRILDINGAKLALIGIENTSGLPQFQKYGDLSQAYAGTESADVKVLLSHDPSYWEPGVLSTFEDIDLTLSGHTHGFQFGIEIPGWVRWSPSQYMYKQWAGLYSKGNQHLYVNRGFGFLGYPGRVGILPEITVLELEDKSTIKQDKGN